MGFGTLAATWENLGYLCAGWVWMGSVGSVPTSGGQRLVAYRSRLSVLQWACYGGPECQCPGVPVSRFPGHG